MQTTEALLLLAWVHCTVNFVLHPGGGAHNYLNYVVKQIAQLREMVLCNLGKQMRFSKECIPRGYITDFNWTTIQADKDLPIKPIKREDPTEDTTAPAAPTEVEGLPSSHLRSKTKQQSATREQGQLECNPAQIEQGQLECNPA